MTQMRKLGRMGLIALVVLALNVFCLLKCAHRKHPAVAHASHMNLHHLPQRGSTRGRSGSFAQASSSNHAQSSVAPRSKPVDDLSSHLAPLTADIFRFTPEFVAAPLAQINILALGSAPRAPGAPRGPPTLS